MHLDDVESITAPAVRLNLKSSEMVRQKFGVILTVRNPGTDGEERLKRELPDFFLVES